MMKTAIKPNSIHTFWYNPNDNSLPIQDANCISSWVHQNKEVYVWTYEGLYSEKLQDLIKEFPNVHVVDAEILIPLDEYFVADYKHIDAHGFAMFSDLFRYNILNTYGGWWLDTDVILLNEQLISSLESPSSSKPLAFYERYSNKANRIMVNNAVIYCNRAAMLDDVIRKTTRAIEITKESDSSTIEWGNTGPILFTDLYEENLIDAGALSDFYIMDFYPHTRSMELLAHNELNSNDLVRFFAQQPLGVHLWNSYLHKSGSIHSSSLIGLCLELASEFEPITISSIIERMTEKQTGTFIDVMLPKE